MAGGGGNSSSQDTSASSSTTSAPTSFYQQDPSYAGKAFTSGDAQPFVPAAMYYQPRGAAPTPSANVTLPGFQNLRNAYYSGPTAQAAPQDRVSQLLSQTNQYNQGYFNSMQQQKADMLQRAQAAAAAAAAAKAQADAEAAAKARADAEQNMWTRLFQNNNSNGNGQMMAGAQGGVASLQGFDR